MCFLSIEQRKRGVCQLRKHLQLIDDDIETLKRALRDRGELRRTVAFNLSKVEAATEGELTADELETVDMQTRERMVYGIPHDPVCITREKRIHVLAGRP